MLSTFEDVKKIIVLKVKTYHIDDLTFRLHYRHSCTLLLACTVLVASRQYIGEHIRCIADKNIIANKNGNALKVIETYCFFSATYTVLRHMNVTTTLNGQVYRSAPHPGIGPMSDGDAIIRHAYYQWVPFVLFIQALMFYLPHIIWKSLEGGRVKSMTEGFEYAMLALGDKPIQINKSIAIPNIEERRKKIARVRDCIFDRLHMNKSWAAGLVFCELLNMANVLLQVWLMEVFLGYRFLSIGNNLLVSQAEGEVGPMEMVFPKVTKCEFRKYGPSGTLERHDALCVMALNVINEKIYAFLWFWFVFLFGVTALSLMYRLASVLLYNRSQAFNRHVFRCCPTGLSSSSLRAVSEGSDYSSWALLYCLARSMDSFVFRDLLDELAGQIASHKPARDRHIVAQRDQEKRLRDSAVVQGLHFVKTD